MGIQVPKANAISQKISSISTNQGLKKKLEDKLAEKTKIFNYIGIETYDLYKAGKLSHPQLDIFFEKMGELEQEISAVEAEIEQAKASAGETLTCSCGNKLSPGVKFCPKCGKPVESEFVLCSCGGRVKRDMAFCPYCGQKITRVSAGSAAGQENGGIGNVSGNDGSVQGKECICGARIPVGQSMCMECGRKAVD